MPVRSCRVPRLCVPRVASLSGVHSPPLPTLRPSVALSLAPAPRRRSLIEACGRHCPRALLNIISNPVNSTVPIAAEVLKKMGTYDERRVMVRRRRRELRRVAVTPGGGRTARGWAQRGWRV